MGDRRDRTTAELLDAAEEELIERGYAAFTMDAVSRRAYFSIGAVYERWGSKGELLQAVADEHLPALIGRDDGVHTDLSSRLVMAELLLASMEQPTLRAPTLEALAWYLHVSDLPELTDVKGWWAAATLLGEALLVCGGADLPDMTSVVPRTLDAMTDLPAELPPPLDLVASAPAELRQRAIPPTPAVGADDVTAQSLREAAERVLVSVGLSATDTRDIAASAGVTTGALYRRFTSKGELLAQVLAARMRPDRYAWSVQLIAAVAAHGASPLTVGSFAGRLLGERLWATASDERERKVLLGLTSAARSNEVVRHQVMTQINTVNSSRVGLLTVLVDAGLLDGNVDIPAAAALLRAPPVGARLLVECGARPDPSVWLDHAARTTIVTLFPGWQSG
jgi:AcrR family transcriptional regulator